MINKSVVMCRVKFKECKRVRQIMGNVARHHLFSPDGEFIVVSNYFEKTIFKGDIQEITFLKEGKTFTFDGQTHSLFPKEECERIPMGRIG